MNFLKRCWQKRWIRGLAWTVVTLVTLYVLLCTWLNWTWTRKWTATVAVLKAEGETLDFRATMNDPVPEADNFCAIPLLKDIALAVDNDSTKGEAAEKRKRLDALKLPDGKKGVERPRLSLHAVGEPTDLKAWADWMRKEGSVTVPADSGNAARDVLAALSKHDSVVQELAAGLSRPKAQWTPEWKTRELPEMLFAIALPHYQNVRNLNQTLALRATAAARAGETAKAHETARIMARLTQADLNDPFLIGLLVASSDATALCGSTWELCDAQAGTVEDFARLEAALSALDFHQASLRACRSELAAAVDTLQFIRRHPSSGPGLFQMIEISGQPNSNALGRAAARAIPLGYFDASAAVLAEGEFKYLVKPLRDHGWQEARQASRDWERELADMKSKIWTHPTYIMVALIAPAVNTIVHKIAYTQGVVNQAIIACALERYRIEKGTYPDSLAAVKLADGKPLPLDVMNDKVMGYRKTTDGKYALWSVGFDGKDDGGKRVLDDKKPENTKFSDTKYVGDWVWDYSGNRGSGK